LYSEAAAVLDTSDYFSQEKHRRIFTRMGEINARGERIDRVTVANELMRHGELASVDGISYLVSLDDGLPQTVNIDGYLNIVREKGTLRRIIFASQNMMNRALLGTDDSGQILADAGEQLLGMGAQDKSGLVTPQEILDGYEGGINAFGSGKRAMGISTGFTDLDEKTSGLHAGDLFVLAARPSVGKTAMALNIAQHVAINLKKTVAIFSLEMSKDQLLARLACAVGRVDSWRYRMGRLNSDERGRFQPALSKIVTAPIYIDDSSSATIMDIHAKLRRLAQKRELGLVIVDYLQLMEARAENRTQEVGKLSRGMKMLAKTLHVPLLLLSQLNRSTETRQGNHKPQLSDLRESGDIEQSADLVAFIFRESMYKPEREDLRGQAELILAKSRNGPIGKVELIWFEEFTKFENRARNSDMHQELNEQREDIRYR
jgi:replicative DNA helicase